MKLQLSLSSIVYGLLTLIWFSIMLVLSLQDGEKTSELSYKAVGMFFTFVKNKKPRERFHFLIRKCAHVFEYSVLIILFFCFVKTISNTEASLIWLILLFPFFWAFIDEKIKGFIIGRHCSFIDFILNEIGCILGLLLCLIVFQ